MWPILVVIIVILVGLGILRSADRGPDPVFPYVVIGGGIAGLYAAYRISEHSPVLLLEASDRLGGRAYQIDWHGRGIKLGAGVIRPGHDHHLINLCRELGIPMTPFDQTVKVYGPQMSTAQKLEIIRLLKAAARDDPSAHTTTFPDYLRTKTPLADTFLHHMGYKDMFSAAAWDTIFNYPINDVVQGSRQYIDWNQLIGALSDGIVNRGGRIETGQKVARLVAGTQYRIELRGGRSVSCHNVIFATDHISAQRIIDASPTIDRDAFDFLNEIGSVPFVRGFSYYKHGLRTDIPSFNITHDTRRFIPYGDGIIMSIYDDLDVEPKSATSWRHEADTRMMSYGAASRLADDFVHQYWPVGIHYYRPRSAAQAIVPREQLLHKWAAPLPGIYFCGEMVSLSQGWVNGAVESVDRLMLIMAEEETLS